MSAAADSPHAGPSKPKKLGGYDFYRSIGSPKWVVAPMVDQSELKAWRLLSRSPLPPALAGEPEYIEPEGTGRTYVRHPGGAHLTYTPMIHSRVFADSALGSKGGDGQFNLSLGEEGSDKDVGGVEGGDRPLIVQFCGNDPEVLLKAAKKVEHRCDAVDINFGCPQGIAKRGNYGAFLQDDWELIKRLIGTLHENLSVPVTAKFRVFPDKERTLAYAKMMEAAGAQWLTCHGRTREMKGQMTGLADWEIIKAVKEAVSIPVFANGNILYREDVDRCLEITGCDGVMTAEGNLSNPALFLPPDHPHFHPNTMILARRYLDIVRNLRTHTPNSCIKSHLFRLFKRICDEEEDLRILIAKAGTDLDQEKRIASYTELLDEIEKRQHKYMDKEGPDWKVAPINPATGYRSLPVFVAQPLIREQPISSEIGGREDLVDQETSINGAGGASRPETPAAGGKNTNAQVKCPVVEPSRCGGIAASRCTRGLCAVHCRQAAAVEAGEDPAEALRKAMRGELVGMGCEAHEAKDRARRERNAEKRKNRADGRRVAKQRRLDAKGYARAMRDGSAGSASGEESNPVAITA